MDAAMGGNEGVMDGNGGFGAAGGGADGHLCARCEVSGGEDVVDRCMVVGIDADEATLVSFTTQLGAYVVAGVLTEG